MQEINNQCRNYQAIAMEQKAKNEKQMNKQCMKIYLVKWKKQECGITKNEKFDNYKIWNYKAYFLTFHNEKPYSHPLNPNFIIQTTIQQKVASTITKTFVAKYRYIYMHNCSMPLHRLCIKINIKGKKKKKKPPNMTACISSCYACSYPKKFT